MLNYIIIIQFIKFQPKQKNTYHEQHEQQQTNFNKI